MTDRPTNRRNGQKYTRKVLVLVHETLPECALQMHEVSLNTSNGYQVIERTRNSIANDQREITPKYSKQRYCSCA